MCVCVWKSEGGKRDKNRKGKRMTVDQKEALALFITHTWCMLMSNCTRQNEYILKRSKFDYCDGKIEKQEMVDGERKIRTLKIVTITLLIITATNGNSNMDEKESYGINAIMLQIEMIKIIRITTVLVLRRITRRDNAKG